MKHVGDITKLIGSELEPVDVITGGSPCQNLSVAAIKRDGLAGEQSWLFKEQIRVTKEMRDSDKRRGRTGKDIRPRHFVWENVYGALSSPGKNDKGKDFQAALTEIIRIAQPEAPDVPMPEGGKWPSAGVLYSDVGDWSVAWRVHDAQFWGVPQRRRRLAVVADFGGMSAGEILFERESVSGDSESSGTERKAYPTDFKGSSNCSGGGSIAYGFKAGNSAKTYSIGLQKEVSPSLVASQSGTNMAPTVVQQVVFENHSQDSRYRYMGDVNETVSAKYGTGGNNQPLVVTVSEECDAY